MSDLSRSKSFLVLLVFLSMLGPLTLNILMPSLPGLAASLDAPKASVQLTLSLYLLGMAVSQLILGPLADRYGRRPVLLFSLLLYLGASVAALVAPNIELLVVARVVQSFGATAGLTLGRTMIRDLFERDRAASMIGYVTMGMVVAPMIAPLLGAVIDDHFGWRAIFAFCIAMGLVSALIAWPNLPETRPDALEAASWREVGMRSLALTRNRRFMAYWGASTFCSGMFFAFLGAAPYLMIDVMGREKTEYGLWFMSLSLGYMIGNYLSGRLSQRLGVHTLILWGNGIGVAGAFVMLAIAFHGVLTPALLFLPIVVTSFGNGLVLPNAIAGGTGTDPYAAGAGSGLMGFGQMGCGALASYLGGKLTTGTAMPLAVIMLTCAVLALVSGLMSKKLEQGVGE